jgi:2,3-dihydroxybiphenyl 1,2-dioxygenase
MADMANLGYLVLGVSDLGRWKEFAGALGFGVANDSGESFSLRMDAHAQRFLVQKGGDDDVRAAGWHFDTEEELDVYVASLREKGLKVEPCSAEQTTERRVQKAFRTQDPNGFSHEFFFGPVVSGLNDVFRSPTLTGPGFRTGTLGMGHLLVHGRDYQASIDFYRRTLGLRLSDRIRQEINGKVADATFFHTRTGRHHSMAVADSATAPKVLNHLMVEVQSMDDVGLAYDRCVAAGFKIRSELGHHPNDRMFSFYVYSPSGFAVEYGWGGIVIDDADWQAVVYSRMSDWGHKRHELV